MTHQLKSRDIIALGFMTFALFVGAGNIIFPPMVGLQAGEHVWTAAIGFLITAVGLPVLTVVALAKVGGGVDSLSTQNLWRLICSSGAFVCRCFCGQYELLLDCFIMR
ncbi:branched-chain amino acid transport system II carrier protein, partial [Salmonella enterica subsp. enterica serovar Montevideo]|nr:branched-chain amino acid transport system II carrier protein [Salmonella enterica subsp. enterica serovar Montevideo]